MSNKPANRDLMPGEMCHGKMRYRWSAARFALYLTFWALAELTNLPVRVLSFVHSVTAERMALNTQYLRQYYPMELACLLTRIVG